MLNSWPCCLLAAVLLHCQRHRWSKGYQLHELSLCRRDVYFKHSGEQFEQILEMSGTQKWLAVVVPNVWVQSSSLEQDGASESQHRHMRVTASVVPVSSSRGNGLEHQGRCHNDSLNADPVPHTTCMMLRQKPHELAIAKMPKTSFARFGFLVFGLEIEKLR